MTDIPTALKDPSWCRIECAQGASDGLPGIHEWRISGGGVYVGQHTDAARRRREYVRNLTNLARGDAYRPAKPDEFRLVHRALLAALEAGHGISFVVLENHADRPAREKRQRELIAEHRARAEQGGPTVLNSERRRKA